MVIVHNTFQDRVILFQRTIENGICLLKVLRHLIGYFSLKNSVERANWSFAQKGTNRTKLKFSTFFYTLLSQKSAPPSSLFLLPHVFLSFTPTITYFTFVAKPS